MVSKALIHTSFLFLVSITLANAEEKGLIRLEDPTFNSLPLLAVDGQEISNLILEADFRDSMVFVQLQIKAGNRDLRRGKQYFEEELVRTIQNRADLFCKKLKLGEANTFKIQKPFFGNNFFPSNIAVIKKTGFQTKELTAFKSKALDNSAPFSTFSEITCESAPNTAASDQVEKQAYDPIDARVSYLPSTKSLKTD